MLMLKVLPEPTLFLRPVPAFVQASLLQKLLENLLDKKAMRRFDALADKRFRFRTFDGVVSLGMTLAAGSIRIYSKPAWDADVIISGDLPALVALCFGLEDPDSLFFSRRLLLTGDTASGLMFKNVLANLDFDLHDMLRHRFGARMADGIWQLAQQVITGVERLDTDMAGMISGIIQRLHLTTADQLKSLRTEVSTIGGQYDAMQHRLTKLEKRLARRA